RSGRVAAPLAGDSVGAMTAGTSEGGVASAPSTVPAANAIMTIAPDASAAQLCPRAPCIRVTPISCPAASRGRFGAVSGRMLRKHLRKLPRFVHLAQDVAAADELAIDVQLRNRRPVRVILDPLPD